MWSFYDFICKKKLKRCEFCYCLLWYAFLRLPLMLKRKENLKGILNLLKRWVLKNILFKLCNIANLFYKNWYVNIVVLLLSFVLFIIFMSYDVGISVFKNFVYNLCKKRVAPSPCVLCKVYFSPDWLIRYVPAKQVTSLDHSLTFNGVLMEDILILNLFFIYKEIHVFFCV